MNETLNQPQLQAISICFCYQEAGSILFLKNGPIRASFLFIFILFLLQFKYKLKKLSYCAWDLNPGLQDGRRRQNHGAMTAT